MIARLFVRTPFVLSVPDGTQFTLFEDNVDGYLVKYLPPKSSETSLTTVQDLIVRVNENPTRAADEIHIDFIKSDFDRSSNALCDPPYEFIKRILDSYVLRLRHVMRAAMISKVPFPETNWNLRYLNDDGSELEQQAGLVRQRWARGRFVSAIGITNEVWTKIHSLPSNYTPLPWEPLLLDAAIPNTPLGNAVVLAATALEVFISYVLDRLAEQKVHPQQLWSWINDRSDHQREPSVEEQFDVLLYALCGHSLKEDVKLWEAFKNLKSARNSFVHQGMIKIGKNTSLAMPETVLTLINSASLIIAKVREWMPPELHWKQFNNAISIQVTHPVFP